MHVVVLGAGVVGTAAAYYLLQNGHQVTVIDRQPMAAEETSFANGGQISACHAMPWAHPKTPWQSLKWLGREDAPLLFRMRFDRQLFAWGLRFLRNCSPERTRDNIEKSLRMAIYSRDCVKQLRRDLGLEYDQLEKGILHICHSDRELEELAHSSKIMREFGLDRRLVTARECLEIEPALRNTAQPIKGGTFSPGDESGDARKFTLELAKICAAQGANFRYNTTIQSIENNGNSIRCIHSDAGEIYGDCYLVCMGSYSPLLTRPLGIKLPIYPCKGYSVTIDTTGHGTNAPTVSLIDDSVKMVYSRFGTRLRAAGTAELEGYSLRMAPRRQQLIADKAFALFPDCGNRATISYWSGLRPVTPDSAPVLGGTKYDNLFLNTGHGTLGWTMSCGSGKAIADLISKKTPEISLDGLGVDRF
ncbi:D-amino acid dehydrogenase [Thalassospira mesophila]|uniref:Amino acid dehydrogenase n=1 Tax=Thalassospira mesophila TaxID=1293891 RepID=A0A1Y2KZT9_9PROT|nr:D-amino acid dehydrogenase [Thalassospira mesophila]OSQ37975.1 amino acid dehydrogenase [Thalassospira mesophila]